MAGTVSQWMENIQAIAIGNNRNAVTVLNQASAAQVSNGNSADLSVGSYSELHVAVNVTAASGTNPTLQIFVDAKGVDGIYYPIPRTTPTITAASQDILSIGAGMNIAQAFGSTIRVRWVLGGTTPSFVFSISLIGK